MNTHNPNDFRYRVRRSDDAYSRFDRIPLAVRTLSSNTLFQGEHEIGIEHHEGESERDDWRFLAENLPRIPSPTAA